MKWLSGNYTTVISTTTMTSEKFNIAKSYEFYSWVGKLIASTASRARLIS